MPLVREPSGTVTDRRARAQAAVERARDALLTRQAGTGAWCFELEADATIPAEYVLMRHFVGDVDRALDARVASYLRARQGDHGGWALYSAGDCDLSCTVKAYFALKLAGDDPDLPHMRRARAAVLERGGAARANVFTRIALALFGELPWRAVPLVPVELVLLPRWSPFHLSKVSYWSRTVVVPLAILCSLRARAVNPTGVGIRELFSVPPETERRFGAPPGPHALSRALLVLDRLARRLYPLLPGAVRRRALARALAWVDERRNGVHGLGAIFPAMVNAYEAYLRCGLGPDDERVRDARAALDRLLVTHGDETYCQPCFSAVWDTGLAAHALLATEAVAPDARARGALGRALAWLADRQVREGPADWRAARPDLTPGGWPFQYANAHYPDLDDTAVVASAMAQAGAWAEPVQRAADWLVGMQSRNGGFAAFDADNTHLWLNRIPFADHGALLDPPTEDVTARVALLLGVLRRPQDAPALARALDFLFATQQPSGAWWGRWGTNYLYGTWSVLAALEHAEDPRKGAAVERAVRWLVSVQQPDGGFGESNDTYTRPELAGGGPSTPCQTAWALLALLAAGRRDEPAAQRAVDWLLATQREHGLWESEEHNAPGFPRVFHLRYHGYSAYFPLWALARWLAPETRGS
jgi:squalene-hopene/tetraprenyl-beta-curcumene cyclase